MTDRELMRQAMDALEDACGGRCNAKNNPCWQRSVANALSDRLAQPVVIPPYLTQPNTKAPEQEPVTGNILKDAYNAVVEKKTRSQKLREAGFTRRPKGWEKEKEKDEQEPVAWMSIGVIVKSEIPQFYTGPLYLTSSQRPWVGLTDEEIIDLIHPLVMADMAEEATDYEIARAIEAKLKEKNGG